MSIDLRLRRLLVVVSVSCLAALSGCGDNPVAMDDLTWMPDWTPPPPPPDMAMARDLVMPPDQAMVVPPDMTQLPDFAIVDLVDPNDYKIPPDFTIADLIDPNDYQKLPDLTPPPDLYGIDFNPGRVPYKYVWNKALMPTQKADYSYDLNGDGNKDNALADLVVNLKVFGVDMQAYVDDGVKTGSDIKLVRIDTDDPLFLRDLMPGLLLRQGMARPNPDYSGNGNFAADNMFLAASYSGLLVNQKYVSVSPTSQPVPTDVSLKFTIFGQNPTAVNLHGTHIQFETGFDMNSGAPGLVNGELAGSIRIVEVKSIIVRDIVAAFNAIIMNNGPTAMLVVQTFDTGGCMNMNGAMAKIDRVIDECEISTSALFMTLLAPDIAIYDNGGLYHPDPMNVNPDSFSVGVGFTAVRANFN